MNADLIRWEDSGDGSLLGRAGTLAHPLFSITGRPRQWVLESWLPPWSATRAPLATGDGAAFEPLKAVAEEKLREFASSIGAVFPEAGERFWRDEERRKIQYLAIAIERDAIASMLRDKAVELRETKEPSAQISAGAYEDAADLIRGDGK